MAAKENVCLVPDLSFDSDITAFDRDPTEKAISWLLQQVQVVPEPNATGSKRKADVALNHTSDAAPEDGELIQGGSEKKPRTDRRGASSKNNHKRAGNPARKLERLSQKLQKAGLTVLNGSYSIVEDGSASSTGWQGATPTLSDCEKIEAAYDSGAIKDMVAKFYPVRYEESLQKPTFLADCEGRIFACRSSALPWLRDSCNELSAAIKDLLHPLASNESVCRKHAHNARGPHIACIIGHYRQYSKEPDLTGFHKQNMDRVNKFISQPIIQRIIAVCDAILPWRRRKILPVCRVA